MNFIKHDAYSYEIGALKKGIFRVKMTQGDKFRESLLSRYHILEEPEELDGTVSETADSYSLTVEGLTLTLNMTDNTVTVTDENGRERVSVRIAGQGGERYHNIGFRLTLPLEENERLFGIGDESRESIARRGHIANINTMNIHAYGPIPYLISTKGYSLFVNCTYPQTFDMGATDKDKVFIDAINGGADFYLFLPESGTVLDNIRLYTDITGKPTVMPRSFYGLMYVMNEMTDVRGMLSDCKEFRREDIPCDMVGLEPQWMETMYDFTTDKKWNGKMFRLNEWMPENNSDNQTFYNALKNMGFKMSLWLCMNYDLLWEEERRVSGETAGADVKYSFDGARIVDPHLANGVYIDEITKRDEPWFDHLKKFVDNGAAAFKLDACTQVLHHADRLWGGRYLDSEVHNVYPVLYVRQMKEGFEEHTKGRRALIYTPCVYAGTQKYAASWAGDTGGGFDTVISMLNFGFCGHTNVTCDIDATPEGLHYGFFSPWSQYMGWNNWLQPWFLTEEMEDMVRTYSKLRSALFPYIYSTAHYASETGVPIVRALSMMYPEVPAYDEVKNTYLFGDAFLVGVFDMRLTLPAGKWVDYFTGEIYEGGREIDYQIPENKGGALFVRAGSIFATMEPLPYLDKKKPDHYDINIYAGGDCAFTLVDDDGFTDDYQHGGMAKTLLTVSDSTDNSFALTVGMRNGSYTGRVRAADAQNSEPVISGIGAPESFTVRLATNEIKSVTLDGKAVAIHDDGTFTVPADLHAAQELHYIVTF